MDVLVDIMDRETVVWMSMNTCGERWVSINVGTYLAHVDDAFAHDHA